MGGCYSKMNKKNGEPASRRGIPPPSVQPGCARASRKLSAPTLASAPPSSAPAASPRRMKVPTAASAASPAAPAASGRPRRSPSASSVSSASSAASTPRPASKLRPPTARPEVGQGRGSGRTQRSRSGTREHPYSRQARGGGGGEGGPATQAVQELQQMADTYRAFKVQRRRYIALPRSCDDNYNADNYTKRLSSETATSSSSSSDRTLISASSMEEAKTAAPVSCPGASPNSPDSAIGSQTTAPTPSGTASVDDSSGYGSATPALTSDSLATVAALANDSARLPVNDPSTNENAVPSTNENSGSAANENAGTSTNESSKLPTNEIVGSSTNESSGLSTNEGSELVTHQSNASLASESAESQVHESGGSLIGLAQQRSTVDLSGPQPSGSRPTALSVSSLNSDDLMLTTDVGLDLEDDDIIKDIDDTEKEDPFVVANALATARGESAQPGPKPGRKSAAKNNLTTPETISSAMSLVQQASGSKLPAPQAGVVSPRTGLVRKKSSPATGSGDSAAKAAVLRRIRAQSNVERPRSFSSPLRPPSRQRSTGPPADDELPVLVAQPDFRHISHDMRSVKLLLLRLKGMLLEDEGHQPPFAEQLSQSFYGQSNLSMSSSSIKQRSDSMSEPTTPLTSDPFSPNGEEPLVDLESAPREALVQEILSLRRTTALLRTKLAEKETTVKLLQQQMTKYVCAGGPAETPPALESLRSYARHPFPGKPLSLDPAGGTEPSSPVVVDPAYPLAAAASAAASSSSASLPNGDAIGLSPRPSLGPRLKTAGGRRERAGAGGATASRPSFLPVNMSQQGKRSISTGNLPHRKTTPLTSSSHS